MVFKLSIILSALLICFKSHGQGANSFDIPTDSDARFWFSGFSLASSELKAQQDGGGQVSAYNYLSINYANNDRSHWSLRLPFIYNTAGFNDFNGDQNQKQGLNLADVLIDYSMHSTLLPWEIEAAFFRFRLETPTSKYSIAQKKIAGIRFDTILTKYVVKNWFVQYWPIFTWNAQTQTVYENPDSGFLSHTKLYELDHRLTLWHQTTPWLNLGFFVGGEDTWFNRSKTNTTARVRENRFAEHLLKIGPSIRYELNKHFVFIFNLQNAVQLWGYKADQTGQMSDLGKFKPSQTEFVLLTFINF